MKQFEVPYNLDPEYPEKLLQRPALIPSVSSAFRSHTDEPSVSSPFFRKTRVRQRKKNSGFWPRWNFSEKSRHKG